MVRTGWAFIARQLTRRDLNAFKDYLKLVEGHLAELLSVKDEKLQDEFKALSGEKFSPEEKIDWSIYSQDELWTYEAIYPRLLRNSLFLAVYAYFEHELVVLCQQVGRRLGSSSSWRDYSRNNGKSALLDRAKKYLKDESKLDLKFNGRVWSDIRKIEKIRHHLIHMDGEIDDRHSLWSYLSSKGLIANQIQISLTGQFCEDVISIVEEFLIILQNSVHKGLAKS